MWHAFQDPRPGAVTGLVLLSGVQCASGLPVTRPRRLASAPQTGVRLADRLSSTGESAPGHVTTTGAVGLAGELWPQRTGGMSNAWQDLRILTGNDWRSVRGDPSCVRVRRVTRKHPLRGVGNVHGLPVEDLWTTGVLHDGGLVGTGRGRLWVPEPDSGNEARRIHVRADPVAQVWRSAVGMGPVPREW